jgi:phosphoglycolate phosphatase
VPAASDLAGAVVVFDLDGTLVDTAPDLIGALNQILGEHGHPGLPLESARVVVGHGARAMLERGFAAVGESLAPARLNRLFERFIELYTGRIALESRPFPGAVAALDRLAGAGARLAVCTNKRTDLSLELLEALDLRRRFAAIIGPDLAPAPKPDPRHLIAAIEAAGAAAAGAVMVGDSRADAEAALGASIPMVAVSFGYSDVAPSDLPAAALIDHFDDLPPLVRRLLDRAPAAISPSLPD